MLRQLDLGRALVAIGALLLFVALFLDWYDAGGTGWEVFETLDLLLAALAVGTVWAALRADDPLPWLLRAGPLVALVIVAVQIVNPPPVLQLATDAIRLEGADDPDTGAWLALAGAALMSAGAVLALARISIVVDLADRRGPVVAPGPEAPAAGGPAEPAPAGGAPGAAAPAPGATGSRRSASLLGGEPHEEHDVRPGRVRSRARPRAPAARQGRPRALPRRGAHHHGAAGRDRRAAGAPGQAGPRGVRRRGGP